LFLVFILFPFSFFVPSDIVIGYHFSIINTSTNCLLMRNLNFTGSNLFVYCWYVMKLCMVVVFFFFLELILKDFGHNWDLFHFVFRIFKSIVACCIALNELLELKL
jgi:hypothetical protein